MSVMPSHAGRMPQSGQMEVGARSTLIVCTDKCTVSEFRSSGTTKPLRKSPFLLPV
jgi:hypothetical protein